MFIHTFAFRWKSGVTSEQKERALKEILALQGQIPGLLETSAGHNVSPRSEGYEFGGVMKFPDQATFEAYNNHPIHQKLLAWLIPLVDAREVDFDI